MTGMSSDSPEMELITQSVENANARIRFFRVAFGLASADQTISQAEISSILGGLTKGGRLSYVWHAFGDCLRTEIKAVFLAFQCLENALAFGGDIQIDNQGGTWVLTGTSDRLNVNTDLWNHLDQPSQGAIIPAHVQFSLLPATLAEIGRHAQVDIQPHQVSIQF